MRIEVAYDKRGLCNKRVNQQRILGILHAKLPFGHIVGSPRDDSRVMRGLYFRVGDRVTLAQWEELNPVNTLNRCVPRIPCIAGGT